MQSGLRKADRVQWKKGEETIIIVPEGGDVDRAIGEAFAKGEDVSRVAVYLQEDGTHEVCLNND